MDELNNVATTTELAEATTKMVATSNGGFWKGFGVGTAVVGGGIALCHFGKKLIKKFKTNKAEKEAEKPVEATVVKPENK